MNLNAIAENFEVSRPAISQHIKILEECGLITICKEGKDTGGVGWLNQVTSWIESCRTHSPPTMRILPDPVSIRVGRS